MDRELEQLIESSFDSVWTLELLLLLHERRGTAWPEASLVEELRSSALVVRQSIAALMAGGLVVENDGGTYTYAPASPELDALVQRLAEDYRSRPDAVRRLIVMPKHNKLQTFSDAFLFRKSNT